MKFLTLSDIDMTNKHVLIREDFNVPISEGKVLNTLRIQAAIPGIRQALKSAAQVILMSHLGRPDGLSWQAEYSLEPIVPYLEQYLGEKVAFIKDWPPQMPKEPRVILLENVRFLPGETENSASLSKQMASLADVFVLDAFGSAHRAHASTVGVTQYIPTAVAGPLVTSEVAALNSIMQEPKRPVVAIIGGAKVSSKLQVLLSLCKIVDVLIVGGGMANTLLAAQELQIGDSLYEEDMLINARELLNLAKDNNCQVILPVDAIVQDGSSKSLTSIQPTDQILDIGPESIALFTSYIQSAATILWNGPVGKFEDPRFANGSSQIAQAIANSNAFSVAGGGETLMVIDNLHLNDKFSYISTGGGAFLEYIEGNGLPAIRALTTKNIKREIC